MTRRPLGHSLLFSLGLLVGIGLAAGDTPGAAAAPEITGDQDAAAAPPADGPRDLGCFPSDAARKAMATVPMSDPVCSPSDECWIDKMAAAGRLADRFPDDVHVQRYYQDLAARRQAYDNGALSGPITERFHDRLARHPDDALAHYLVGRWEDSRDEMHKSAALDPRFAWPHQWLARYSVSAGSAGASAGSASAAGTGGGAAAATLSEAPDALAATPETIASTANELDAFLKLCPGRLDAVFQNGPGTIHPDVRRAQLPILRRALEAAPRADQIRWLAIVWDQEFKARPATEHEAVRRTVAADLARVEAWQETRDEGWWQVQHHGREILGDPDALERLDAAYARRFPCSRIAVDRLQDAWTKQSGAEHGFDAVPQAVWADAYRTFGRAADRCPDEYIFMSQRFAAATHRQPPLPDRRLESEADRYLEGWEHIKGNWGVGISPYYEVATEYLRRRIEPEAVLDLVARDRDYHASWNRQQPREQLPPEIKKASEEGAVLHEFDLLGMEADANLMAGRRAQAETAIAAAGALQPLPVPHGCNMVSAAETRARYERVRAALGLPGDSVAAGGPAPSGDATAAMPGDRLWVLKNDTLPEWTLTDLDGHSWRSSDLIGRTVVVNVWATWCGPCRAELPSVKALHERLRGREDVVLLSFNIDQEVGLVAPFARARGLTYPILLAADYVQALDGMTSVPQTWLIGPEGVRRDMQLGFEPQATGWVDETLALIDRVASGATTH